MAKPLLTDELWALIEPLLPKRPPKPVGGLPHLEDRVVLTGILFVLRTGIPWEYLPKEMGCGSEMTCRRRLRDWQEAGVWSKVHKILLDRLRSAGRIDFSRVVVDSGSLRAVFGGQNRAEPNGSAQKKLETPHHHRCGRHSACLSTYGSQPTQRDPTHGLG